MGSNGNFDSLLLQSLMGRLQLRPPYLNTNSYLSQSLEDFLLETNSINDEDEDEDDIENEGDERTLLSKEESKLEKQIIRTILAGNIEILKPNSGQAVTIGEHHICVGFHQEKDDSDYRVWEWHGHIMLFDDENGYTPEYIYGNYFERLLVKPSPPPLVLASPPPPPPTVIEEEEEEEEEKEDKAANLGGLKELIDGGDLVSGHILRRNMNADSAKF
ncbi:hypothetical protein AQUCO_01000694v1 [Aquilegia coerulea]|uniref:Uncharacterized protein n=1 Tax=Aquilegia coerulea TaxID=218851 RepID=A0A2G5EB63_AQUCA|nr:hypothetical protein AQUCO_01000694v1 [Aquilegia coerulea]